MKRIQISLVIPAKDEEKSINPLYKQIVEEMNFVKKTYEIIFIDDGSVDKTVDAVKLIQNKDKRVKLVIHRGNFGKSAALSSGFKKARGNIIITLDADLQDNPNEIKNFLSKLNAGYDLVSGWKKTRYDPLAKTIPSKIGNWLTRRLTGIEIHDLNCGFKAYKREVIKSLNLYGEMYKYIPVLAQKQKFRVTEIVVSHRPRKFGVSKFGWERNAKGLLDLITVFFLTGYLQRPGHFFGSLGLISFSGGFVIGLYITYLRMTTGSIQFRHPLLYLGMLLMIVGIQLLTTGLIAELIVSFNENNTKKTSR